MEKHNGATRRENPKERKVALERLLAAASRARTVGSSLAGYTEGPAWLEQNMPRDKAQANIVADWIKRWADELEGWPFSFPESQANEGHGRIVQRRLEAASELRSAAKQLLAAFRE